MSKSQVSRLCAEIDERVNAFLARPLEGAWPYLWLDATYVKVREVGRIISRAVRIAVAVNEDGKREVVGVATGPSEAFGRWPSPFWTEFPRSLADRGLRGVKLVIADDHSLRHVGQTGPYMHSGLFETLPGIIRFYAGGGGSVWARNEAEAHRPLYPFAARRPESLRPFSLTPAEIEALAAFLNAI